MTGFEGKILWKTIPSRPLDIKILVGDATKSQVTLGWKAKYSLEDGLKKT
ncbi:GDP-mannose 4,6-dehydratase, partial [Candidatus Daviesbacteria bacterium]|nr:GDP-mannose 4,6-dehydratase [Candidatus Daviesbacteria bacterium]